MVCYQHVHLQLNRPPDAFQTGNTVIDRDQHVGCMLFFRFVHNGRRQSVTVVEPVRNHIISRCAQQFQATQGQGAGRCPVTVVIRNDRDLPAKSNGIRQKRSGPVNMKQTPRRNQAGKPGGQFGRVGNAARGKNPGENGMDSCTAQILKSFGGERTDDDSGHDCKISFGRIRE